MSDKKHQGTPRGNMAPAEHRKQIDQYAQQRNDYVIFAAALQRILQDACRPSFPEAMVQSRAKTVSSFAEKVVRKSSKYHDAVNQFSDLCAARVIVQTAGQVKAVRLFIEANFTVLEKDDKGLRLGEAAFGYRDMHYVVSVPPERDRALRITPEERRSIGNRRAEIQVRTWLQHAWADTLHDRIYKTRLALSSEIGRTAALLAALMEAGDRNFNELAEELDEMIANYTAFAGKEDVANEIGIQRLILENEPQPENKPALAMGLARLFSASGDYAEVVTLLDPYCDLEDPLRCELLLELGDSLCRLHRGSPHSPEYGRGLNFLKEALALCESREAPLAPDLRKREGLHARALVRLAWALEVVSGEEYLAREKYHQAHERQPANPYYLAQMLGYEMFVSRTDDLPDSMRATILAAIETCRQHALAGTELPYAYFTAGRLSLLIKADYESLAYYARGARHFLAGVHYMPQDVLTSEVEWLARLYRGKRCPRQFQQVIDLLKVGREISTGALTTKPPAATIAPPVLVVAGGAATVDAVQAVRIRSFLQTALVDFAGTVICGGTAVGVPGCVGDVAQELSQSGRKQFRLIGYVPVSLPYDAPPHAGYDELVKHGEGFQPDQAFRYWFDITAAGIHPQDVLLLGIGGGQISAIEYRMALGLGASVGVIADSGGAVARLLDDPIWSRVPNLFPLPCDAMTIRAFAAARAQRGFDEALEAMAKSIHAAYVAKVQSNSPAKALPWHELDETFQKANIEQARYSIRILEAAGFGVRAAEDPVVFSEFTAEELEKMAELEHGRWNVDRLREGWRWGSRDDAMKLHDCLVPWNELTEEIKNYDREAVLAFPAILAEAKMEVFRKG
jgi:ppGpp synthetase/RelA/SpoT-type nucleotidyltranferase